MTYSKELKWTTQPIPNMMTRRPTRPKQGRVQKRKTERDEDKNQVSQHVEKLSAASKTASDVKQLEKELAFAYDSLATILVHFESVRNAFLASQSSLGETQFSERANDMEKEIHAAYNDLKLQIVHLERTISKLERQLNHLRQQAETGSSEVVMPAGTVTGMQAMSPTQPPPALDANVLSPASASAASLTPMLSTWSLPCDPMVDPSTLFPPAFPVAKNDAYAFEDYYTLPLTPPSSDCAFGTPFMMMDPVFTMPLDSLHGFYY